VFVDGCFWHGCPIHSHIPKSNQNYWRPKLRKNIERDKEKDERLRIAGWTVIRFWEHDMEKISLVLRKINEELAGK
jgi:DNA mismatch endonuclease (patch repair protein)